MPNCGEPRRGPHDEDAAIPPVLLRFDITLREFEVRLFDEAVEVVCIERAGTAKRCAQANIAVTGFRMGRDDPHRDDMAFVRVLHACSDRCMERFDIGDSVVGGHHHHDAVVILRGNRQRRDRQRGCGVASGGFQNEPARLAAGA